MVFACTRLGCTHHHAQYPKTHTTSHSGHGTHVVDGQLVATVCGVVQRVNKLVAVRSTHSRYNAEVGDVVVGRVVEVCCCDIIVIV